MLIKMSQEIQLELLINTIKLFQVIPSLTQTSDHLGE